MGVAVTEHDGRIEIVQKPDIAPGTIGWNALLLAGGLVALCVVLVIIGAVLVGQFRAGAIPAAEFWVAVPLMGAGTLGLAIFALWEMSNAFPRRIGITATAIAVKFATPIPFAFDIPRQDSSDPKASVHYRLHRNYAKMPAGRYMTIRSRKPYVLCGRRLIGPMDEGDATALSDALNLALSSMKPR